MDLGFASRGNGMAWRMGGVRSPIGSADGPAAFVIFTFVFHFFSPVWGKGDKGALPILTALPVWDGIWSCKIQPRCHGPSGGIANTR